MVSALNRPAYLGLMAPTELTKSEDALMNNTNKQKQIQLSGPWLTKWVLLIVFTGLLAGSASAFFLHALDWVTETRNQHPGLIFGLPLAGLLIGLLYYYVGKEASPGNRGIVREFYKPQKPVSWLMAPLVLLGTLLTHLVGGSAGREGTALQMAASLADRLSAPFNLSAIERQILLSMAISAGFGSVFGTPWAGAVFALELLLFKPFRPVYLVPVFISSFWADWVCSYLGPAHSAYEIPILPEISLLNLGYTALAGLVFGMVAFLYLKTHGLFEWLFKSSVSWPPFRPVTGGLVLLLIFLFFPLEQYMGLGIPFIQDSFIMQGDWYVFLIKLLLTAFTLAAGFKGGEVTPLFFIGAALGNFLSFFVPLPIALMAGMGFVAVFSSAAHTPLAGVLLGMELFGWQVWPFMLVSGVFAWLFSGKESLYFSDELFSYKKKIINQISTFRNTVK